MDFTTLISALESRPFLVIDTGALEELLAATTTLREVDTGMSGLIRVLAAGDSMLVQEKSDTGEILVRRVADRAAADILVGARLEIYDRMWDGCGCKIDYYR